MKKNILCNSGTLGAGVASATLWKKAVGGVSQFDPALCCRVASAVIEATDKTMTSYCSTRRLKALQRGLLIYLPQGNRPDPVYKGVGSAWWATTWASAALEKRGPGVIRKNCVARCLTLWPLLVRQRSVAASGLNLPAVNQALNFDGGGLGKI